MPLVDPALSLKILGNGPESEKLKILVSKSGLNERVHFYDSKKGKDLLKMISEAHAVIVPSQWPENMPLSLLESMAMGKTVIVANSGGMPERIINGQNGFIFEAGSANDLAEKINHLKDYDLERMGEKAKESIRDFSPENHYKELMAIYIDKIKNKC